MARLAAGSSMRSAAGIRKYGATFSIRTAGSHVGEIVKKLLVALLSAVLALGAAVPAMAKPPAKPCSPDRTVAGGEWSTYGADLANTRSQPAETTLNPAVAAGLAPAWSFTSDGAINATPIVANGCIYFGTENGHLYARDADTGAPVWDRVVTVGASGAGLGGTIVGSPAVQGSTVIFLVSDLDDPYALALDMRTGAIRWKSAPIDDHAGSYTNASAVIFDGVLFAGFSAPEGQTSGQGGWALFDASTGALLKRVDTIPLADQAKGYAGGGIWSTPAVDTATGMAYLGAGNPFSKMIEHDYTNSILKIDLNRASLTFGQVVGFYKGNVDQYTAEMQELSHTPACAASDTDQLTWPLDDPVCGQLDLDFGASAQLFHDANGRLLVGDLQKSGVYHAAHADDMSAAWTALVGLSCAACNASSPSFDGTNVNVAGVPGPVLYALDRTAGTTAWRAPMVGGTHYQPMATAAGVVYTVDNAGFLDAWDAATAAVVLTRPITADAGTAAAQQGSGGVVIARHTVYAPASNALVAYRAAS